MFNFLKKVLSSDKNVVLAPMSKQDLLDVNACPNCWGKQDYNNQFVDYLKDQTKSQINHDKSQQKAFVQKFVQTHITGIRLKREGDKLTCPSCKAGFKTVSGKAN